jgi:hypothetical protein
MRGVRPSTPTVRGFVAPFDGVGERLGSVAVVRTDAVSPVGSDFLGDTFDRSLKLSPSRFCASRRSYASSSRPMVFVPIGTPVDSIRDHLRFVRKYANCFRQSKVGVACLALHRGLGLPVSMSLNSTGRPGIGLSLSAAYNRH